MVYQRFLSFFLVFSLLLFGCTPLSEGLNELTSFCNAVGDKCAKQTGADCVSKLGADTTILKKIPDYEGAKACLDSLTVCDELPNECWDYAVKEFR